MCTEHFRTGPSGISTPTGIRQEISVSSLHRISKQLTGNRWQQAGATLDE
jgi:hypothetical protein